MPSVDSDRVADKLRADRRVDPKTVQAILRHAKFDITMDRKVGTTKNGRPVRARTADLHRVKVAL
jgi:hypothetical protein